MFRTVFRRILVLALAAFLLAANPAAAAEKQPGIDLGQKGSITIKLTENNDGYGVSSNASFTLYHVAAIDNNSENITYVFTDDFSDCGLSLDDADGRGLASELAGYAEKNKLTGAAKDLDETGTVVFSGLELGIYLIVQTGSVSGCSVLPMLVYVPTPDPSGTYWIYDIEAEPKTEPEPDQKYTRLKVRKVWQDEDGTGRPASVTVELICNDWVKDSAVLNEGNDWEHVWEDLPGGNTYHIREKDVPWGYQVSYEKGEYEIVVINTAKMPQTGLPKWPVPVLAVTGLVLIVAGLAIIVVKKRKKNE